MNRADRRKNKKKNRYVQESNRQRAERIVNTGVVLASDLKKEYEAGYRAAIKSTEEYMVPFFFSALACSLKDNFRFGEERITRVFRGVIETMNEEITAQDMIDRCKRETGLDIINYVKDNPV